MGVTPISNGMCVVFIHDKKTGKPRYSSGTNDWLCTLMFGLSCKDEEKTGIECIFWAETGGGGRQKWNWQN